MSNLNLMVGDYVNYIGKPVKCNIKTIYAISLIVGDSFMYKPIPLSPKVMEKIEGVKKVGRCGYYITDDIVVYYRDNHFIYDDRLELPYLHQLQQLIRLFTNKEIEVKWGK